LPKEIKVTPFTHIMWPGDRWSYLSWQTIQKCHVGHVASWARFEVYPVDQPFFCERSSKNDGLQSISRQTNLEYIMYIIILLYNVCIIILYTM
jgi:hypothetical protein